MSVCSSDSLPTNVVRALLCRASKRLSTVRISATRHTATGPEMPFRVCFSSATKLNSRPIKLCVVSSITTQPGSATPWSRAARLGVAPEMAPSSDTPPSAISPTTTRPVAIPTRASNCSSGVSFSRPTAFTDARAARTACSASSSWARG